MDKYICEQCGGHIDPHTMKCEYCGTQYKRDMDNVIRVETYRNPVRTYSAVIKIPREMSYEYGLEKTSEIAIESLTKELAKGLAENMVLESSYDEARMMHHIRGTVKIVQPENISDRWRLGW